MEAPRRILVLTADAGFGHRSAANAIADALRELYGMRCEVQIVNPLEDRRTPFFLRDSQTDYDKIVRSVPELYRIGYDASDATVPTALLESALIVLMYEVIQDLLHAFQPDAIISTYPLYTAPISAVFTIRRQSVPLYLAVTDLVSVHRVWFNPKVDRLLVPTPEVATMALSYGFSPERVAITGIPINPVISKMAAAPVDELRARLGWLPNVLTVLAVGSKRMTGLLGALQVINHFGYPLQLAVVTGRDSELFAELTAVEWHVPVHLYEFVTHMPELMHASDCIVTKAGGLIVTESLAAGLPMLLVDLIPGQETGNASYVVENGAGDLASGPQDVLEALGHWTMDSCRLLQLRAANARRLGKPQAAYEAAEMIWQAAQIGPPKREKSRSWRPRLVELLTSNQVPWQTDDSLMEDRDE
ncbi:MAG TPA: glycosyltransferase [Anaerolineaceae bacterium]|nr:glycosyltransferase [Anaerolineaceae bacterium]